MKEWMQTATQAAEKVYSRFIDEVIEKYVINDRENRSLGDITLQKIEKNVYVDPRALRLMCISGKGGYVDDPKKQKLYDNYNNINLLDHILSVTRGALVLCAADLMSLNPDMDLAFLNQKLNIIAVTGFMHDLDKDLELPRNTTLETSHVEERMFRYGINDFLTSEDISLSASQLRYLVEKVESTQAHRHSSDEPLPSEYEHLPLYVRLADKLDGAWASLNPDTGGFKGVLNCIKDDKGCLHTDILKEWKQICFFDPHHPFLLDELQQWLSVYSRKISGIYPLIEVHQDGQLSMLLPKEYYDEIVRQAVDMLCSCLPFNLELTVSVRGIPALANGNPSHETLKAFIESLDAKNLSDLFKIKQGLIERLKEPLDDLLDVIGLEPRWPKKSSGALTTLYASFENMGESEKESLYKAAHLLLLLNLKTDAKPKSGIPDYSIREKELLEAVPDNRPQWITSINDTPDYDASRRTVTALWITAIADENEDVFENIWGAEGILKKWLEGNDEIPGLNQFIGGEGTEVLKGVSRHFLLLLNGNRIEVEDENAAGRCLFTDEPVFFSKSINQALGLYGVKVSAFSGRDNRPESVTSDRSHTNVGNSSVGEHKLRSVIHKLQGGKDNGVPTLISSPTTCGLFGGLGMTDDKSMTAMSAYDLNRLDVKKGKVLHGIEMFKGRCRMAKFERIPEKMEEQINMMRMLLTATRRIGRPLHIFRGLPTHQAAYFYFDAMPRVLSELLGGHALRLEQIPNALKHIEMAQSIIETNGLGHDVLKRYAMHKTRFGAVCLIWCHLKDEEKKDSKKIKNRKIFSDLYNIFTTYTENKQMNENDGAFVRLGQAAAGIQRYPGSMASTSDELLVFKICMDALNASRRAKQEDELSLIYAIAGELETGLIRKDKMAARKWRNEKKLTDACLELADIFVKDIWFGTLKGRLPNHSSRRVLSSIYRMAFLQKHHQQLNTEKEKKNKGE